MKKERGVGAKEGATSEVVTVTIKNGSTISLGIALFASVGILLVSTSIFDGNLSAMEFAIEALPIAFALCGIGLLILPMFKFRRPVDESTYIQNFTSDEEIYELNINSVEEQVTIDPDFSNQKEFFKSLESIDKILDKYEEEEEEEPEDRIGLDSSSYITSSADPIAEANVLIFSGKSSQAIELLLAYFELHGSDSDSIALELVSIIENEINKEDVDREWLKYLYSKRNNILFKLQDKRSKLSNSTWSFIQQLYIDQIESGMFGLDGLLDTEAVYEERRIRTLFTGLNSKPY